MTEKEYAELWQHANNLNNASKYFQGLRDKLRLEWLRLNAAPSKTTEQLGWLEAINESTPLLKLLVNRAGEASTPGVEMVYIIREAIDKGYGVGDAPAFKVAGAPTDNTDPGDEWKQQA